MNSNKSRSHRDLEEGNMQKSARVFRKRFMNSSVLLSVEGQFFAHLHRPTLTYARHYKGNFPTASLS